MPYRPQLLVKGVSRSCALCPFGIFYADGAQITTPRVSECPFEIFNGLNTLNFPFTFGWRFSTSASLTLLASGYDSVLQSQRNQLMHTYTGNPVLYLSEHLKDDRIREVQDKISLKLHEPLSFRSIPRPLPRLPLSLSVYHKPSVQHRVQQFTTILHSQLQEFLVPTSSHWIPLSPTTTTATQILISFIELILEAYCCSFNISRMMKSLIPSFRPQRPFRLQTCHSQRLEQAEEEYLLIQKGIGST